MGREDTIKKVLRETVGEGGPVKYPRTFHLPFSKSLERDDRLADDLSALENEEVIVTEKLDGENTTCYKDYFHPRSTVDDGHPSRSWIKGFKAQWDFMLPDGWRVCGENMFATHSIKYENLDDYFYCFSIWDENNYALDWDKTVEWCEYLGITPVPVMYRGPFDIKKIQELFENIDESSQEGIVVRPTSSFHYDDFHKYVVKAVRSGHVQTGSEHWTKNWEKNKLKGDKKK